MDGRHERLYTLGQAADYDEVCGSETLIDLTTTHAVSKSIAYFLREKDEETFGVQRSNCMRMVGYSFQNTRVAVTRLSTEHSSAMTYPTSIVGCRNLRD